MASSKVRSLEPQSEQLADVREVRIRQGHRVGDRAFVLNDYPDGAVEVGFDDCEVEIYEANEVEVLPPITQRN